jgi:sarcosine oxidase subunit alpha
MGRVPVPAREPAGPHAERWRHLRGCGRFFNALRDTTTDRIAATYRSARSRRAGRRAVSAYRTPSGGRVDRSRPFASRFDGRAARGIAGRHAGSGAARQRRAPRRPLVQVPPPARHHDGRRRGAERARHGPPRRRRETPNLRATQVELYDGLVARVQNRWPSLASTRTLNDFLSPLFPAGFYYKTFMWPRGAWAALYEPLIRRARARQGAARAGSGSYAQRFAHCDVLVVGAGPAGLARRARRSRPARA